MGKLFACNKNNVGPSGFVCLFLQHKCGDPLACTYYVVFLNWHTATCCLGMNIVPFSTGFVGPCGRESSLFKKPRWKCGHVKWSLGHKGVFTPASFFGVYPFTARSIFPQGLVSLGKCEHKRHADAGQNKWTEIPKRR